eukprot:TRINITY_DN23400_c0_g1_i1.p1 TRINITY_DN23400_c0_g1~~TRINITY_DN23400_c0_g1_i1.p1  ORF type:complete len:180 (-),score=28.47 TRINITY_DN23400_c0_g1_i1:236-748(-)
MPVPVILHIYDVTGHEVVTGVNEKLRLLGTGAFHGAVEVYGQEWSFGYCEEGTGVFSCPPRGCSAHSFRESVSMGETSKTETEVFEIIAQFENEWPGSGYDLLRRNCCSFSDEFCVQLGVGHIPAWVTRRISSCQQSGRSWCDRPGRLRHGSVQCTGLGHCCSSEGWRNR